MISGTLAKSTLAAFRIAPPLPPLPDAAAVPGARLLASLGLVPVEKVAFLFNLLILSVLWKG